MAARNSQNVEVYREPTDTLLLVDVGVLTGGSFGGLVMVVPLCFDEFKSMEAMRSIKRDN
jgi:hypothetical protein